MKSFNKDHKQSNSSQFKSKDKGKKDTKNVGQYTIPFKPKCFKCQSFGHIKQECPTYLQSIGKSKAFAATLSDIEPETKSDDNDDKGILSAFTATVDPTKRIVEAVDEEEDLVENMRSYIGCLLRILVKWSWNERSCPQRLMKQIKPLEH